jgi:hypothetical protein
MTLCAKLDDHHQGYQRLVYQHRNMLKVLLWPTSGESNTPLQKPRRASLDTHWIRTGQQALSTGDAEYKQPSCVSVE